MKKRIIIGLAGVTLAGIALVGCGDKQREWMKDSPIAARDNTPADVFNMPDGFSNFAAKCEGPNRVYVAFKGDANRAAIAVVPNDPRCVG